MTFSSFSFLPQAVVSNLKIQSPYDVRPDRAERADLRT